MYEKDPVKIFVVEDDPAYTKFLKYVLGLNPDYEVEYYTTGKDCLANLYKNPAIITLDYSLPDMPGEKVLGQIRGHDPNINVIIVSAQEKIHTAVELLKSGAYDYISKDHETKERLLNSINNARNKTSLIKEIDHLKKEISEKYEFEKSIVGTSPAIRRMFALLEKAVQTNISVSISGETGTGKELVAKAIHYNSKRKSKPFVAVNIAAIPRDLIESELFGHEKGAFTGANTRSSGRFEQAEVGTLFLDEIGDMPLAMQAKILRVLQERQFERVGGTRSIGADVRVIAATHQDLEAMAAEGRFRSDLFYRLQGVRLVMPPLRERIDDLPLLVTHLLERAAQRLWRQPATVSTEGLRCLWTYPWPGNIRELQHVLEGAMVLSDGVVLPEHLPPAVQRGSKAGAAGEASPAVTGSLDEALEDWERRAILNALQKANGVQARAAKILGITERSLWYRVKKLKIQVRISGESPDRV